MRYGFVWCGKQWNPAGYRRWTNAPVRCVDTYQRCDSLDRVMLLLFAWRREHDDVADLKVGVARHQDLMQRARARLTKSSDKKKDVL